MKVRDGWGCDFKTLTLDGDALVLRDGRSI